MSEFISILERIRPGYDKGGMVKLVEYVESLPKGTTVTLEMVKDYVKKNKLKVNIQNFFNRRAPKIKGKKFISDTRVKDLKLTDTEKANIEKYGKAKYDKLNTQDKYAVRQGREVGKLAPEKTQKVKFKKEYDKAIKYYKKKGVEPNMDTIRKNIAANKGKFKATGVKVLINSVEIGVLYGGDWLMMPVTVVDAEDIEVQPLTDDTVILEYAMFYEEG